MDRGYVKDWRKIEDSGLIQLPNTFALFMHLLLKASHKDTKRGTPTGVINLKRGQHISGIYKLSDALNQSERQIRTSIDRLVKLGIITVKATNKYSVYIIVNYSKYQAKDATLDKQTTSEELTEDNQATTKQEAKNLSILESINTSTGNEVANCPHEEILKLYAIHLPMLTQVKFWSDSRSRLLKVRWRENSKRQSLDWWDRFFKYIAESDFLTGRATNFQADIEWILNSKNFIKILEGKYANKVAA